MIHIEDVEEGWVHFKYERLPTFCYCCGCGILGHQERECQKVRKSCLLLEEEDLKFGPRLRACCGSNSWSKEKQFQPI